MESVVSNAQLMNAIKHLTRKVEALETEIKSMRGVSSPSKKKRVEQIVLPSNWKYSEVNQSIVNAVLSSSGIREAAASLSMTEKELKTILEDSGIPHLYAEKWSIAIKRAISGEPMEDNFEYPEEWFDKKEKIKAYMEEHNITKTAEKLGKPAAVVGRFIKLHC